MSFSSVSRAHEEITFINFGVRLVAKLPFFPLRLEQSFFVGSSVATAPFGDTGSI